MKSKLNSFCHISVFPRSRVIFHVNKMKFHVSVRFQVSYPILESKFPDW